MLPFDGIFCLTLDRRQDRWIIAESELKLHGVSAEKYIGKDGKQLVDQNQLPNSDGVRLRAGDIGCAFSHRSMVAEAKRRGWKSVLLLEDDVEFTDDFVNKVLSSISELPANWDLLYFGGNHSIAPIKINGTIHKITHTYTTHSYAVRDTAYDLILSIFPENPKDYNKQVDVYYADIQKQCNAYCTIPHLAWQKPGFSDIQEKITDYPFLKNKP